MMTSGLGLAPIYSLNKLNKPYSNNRNNCFIFSVFGNNSVDHNKVRRNIARQIHVVINRQLESSNKETRAVFLHYLDFNYDLGMHTLIDTYVDKRTSDSKSKSIEKQFIFETESRINDGSMLDVVFAGKTLANIAKRDICVSSKVGNTPVEYNLESDASDKDRIPVHVTLNDEHFTPRSASPAFVSLNYVEPMTSSLLSLQNFIQISLLDFMMFTMLEYVKSREITYQFSHISNIYVFQQQFVGQDNFSNDNVSRRSRSSLQQQASFRSEAANTSAPEERSTQAHLQTEPAWQSIARNPNKDSIARQYGYNDFYQMATTQNTRANAQKQANQAQGMVSGIEKAQVSRDAKAVINDKIESVIGKKCIYNGKMIDFTNICDPITLDEFDKNDEDNEWCAIPQGASSDGKDIIYSLIKKSSLVEMLKSGNITHPISRNSFQEKDVLLGEEFLEWLKKMKEVN
ncbi:MAG: hypothetical protein ACK5Z5_01890 [Neisseriaceae bacterium]